MKYIKRPLVVEAKQWTGNNYDEIRQFVQGHKAVSVNVDGAVRLHSANGYMAVNQGDFIIIGHSGNVYPCNETDFREIYQKYQLYNGDPDVLQA